MEAHLNADDKGSVRARGTVHAGLGTAVAPQTIHSPNTRAPESPTYTTRAKTSGSSAIEI